MKEPDLFDKDENKIIICPFCNFENIYKINKNKTEEQEDLPITHLISCKNCGEKFQITVSDSKSKISFGWPLI
ncbi:MAG: hypothetical protein ACFFAH_07690 [Promethearchaeota archaeon]